MSNSLGNDEGGYNGIGGHAGGYIGGQGTANKTLGSLGGTQTQGGTGYLNDLFGQGGSSANGIQNH